jgi:hypothetical protein
MKKLFAALVLGLFVIGCAGPGSITSIPWKVWKDANIPCEGGTEYDYRHSTCEALDAVE